MQKTQRCHVVRTFEYVTPRSSRSLQTPGAATYSPANTGTSQTPMPPWCEGRGPASLAWLLRHARRWPPRTQQQMPFVEHNVPVA